MQVKLSPSQVQDSGKVRLGNMSPSFPAPPGESTVMSAAPVQTSQGHTQT